MRLFAILSSVTLVSTSLYSASYYNSSENYYPSNESEYSTSYYSNQGYNTPGTRYSSEQGNYSYSNDPRSNEDPNYYYSSGNQPNAQDDSGLLKRVRNALKGDGSQKDFTKIDTRVSQGVVTLRGTVNNEKDHREAYSRIQNLPGVQHINDKLEINDNGSKQTSDNDDDMMSNKPKKGEMSSDRALTKKIQDAVNKDTQSDRFKNVSVEVMNSKVTLKGTVGSADDKTRVQDIVQRVDGVEDIDNQITVKASKYSY